MTVNQAAKEIGLSPDAVYSLCAKGLLGHRRVGVRRGRIQILPSHIAAYLASTEVPTGDKGLPTIDKKKSRLTGRLDGQPCKWVK